MDELRNSDGLNPSQRRHLLTSCQYADKLLADIEAAQSKSPFQKSKPDLSPVQAKTVQDYIARVRSHLIRILDSQGVSVPEPILGSLHSIRVTLGFIEIAFDECRPKRMAGYGEMSSGAGTALSGVVDEIQGIVARLDRYLAEGRSADLEERLHRLESAGADLGLVKALERAIHHHGFVEFRPALANIVERMENRSFEIAVFGRVSCGKSSLLNHILGQDVLPVGVNPVTAVPTRLVYGTEPRATAWFADRKAEQFTVDRLADFVTEERNPGNTLHVTRIVVEVPAARLGEGIVYVDTPGLGGLATSGAAETKAYLPWCDHGVVLVDAGSTLSQEDLATIQSLHEAGTAASVLLSKADLLSPADRARARQYVVDHIRTDLGQELPVHPVSIRPGFTDLLDSWLELEILPLYGRHAELARASLNRKIGALRLGVEAVLKAHLGRSTVAGGDKADWVSIDAELRFAAGRIAEARTECIDITDRLRDCGPDLVRVAAVAAIEVPHGGAAGSTEIVDAMERALAQRSASITSAIQTVARGGFQAVHRAAQKLGLDAAADAHELDDLLKNKPRFDLGTVAIKPRRGALRSLQGRHFTLWSLERQLRAQIGRQVDESVHSYARVLQAWVRKTFALLQEGFDAYADTYRAQLNRLGADANEGGVNEDAIRADLAALATEALEAPVQRSAS
jgi:GTP-binding protein EngB required for normal cell division